MIEKLRSRRSVRKFKSIPLEQQTIDLLKEAVLRSPSSRGINPWEFIFVTKPEKLASLSKSKEHGSGFLNHAALAIVICGDENKTDVWIEDCSIASTIALLTAHSIGLGSCWIQIRNRKHNNETTSESYIRNILNIPLHYRVESIIAIGYPDETPLPIDKNILDFNKIHENSF